MPLVGSGRISPNTGSIFFPDQQPATQAVQVSATVAPAADTSIPYASDLHDATKADVASLATVAFSGSFLDLTNTPPAATSVQPDTTFAPLMAQASPVIGASLAYAREDHVHPTDTSRAAVSAIPVVSTLTPSPAATPGTYGSSLAYARADHAHPTDTSRAATTDIPAASTTTPSPAATTGTYGASLAYARADHVHPLPTLTYAQLPAGLQNLPLGFVMSGKPLSGQTFNLVMGVAVTIPANFAGACVYDGTLATANTVFTLNKISGGTTTPIGTITVTSASHTSATLSTQAAVVLAAGDVLQVVAPVSQDATLADIGITIIASRN